jgi:GNAT superfamily N-acetyltransferase
MVHKEVKVRWAEPKDLDALVSMQVKFEKFFQNIGCDQYDITPAGVQERRNDIEKLNFSTNPLLRTFVAEVDGHVIGRVSFYRGHSAGIPPYYNFNLAGLFVDPDYRGLRIAEKLFAALTELGKQEGITKIRWSVWGPNKSAARFYERIGGKYYQQEDDEHFMFLKLK